MDLISMRGSVIVDIRLVTGPDGIDDKFVSLVTPDRLAVPGGLWFRRMWHVEVDASHLGVQLVVNHDLRRGLDEMNGLHAREHREPRHTRRPAMLAGDIGDLAGEHHIVGLFHPFDDPGLQDWISEVSDAVRGLLAGTVRDIGTVFRRHHRARPARRWQKVVAGRAVRYPSRVAVAHEIRNIRARGGRYGAKNRPIAKHRRQKPAPTMP